SGAGNLAISGAGTTVITGLANTYTGATILSGAATLRLSDLATLGTSSGIAFSGSGAGVTGTLELANTVDITQGVTLNTAGSFNTLSGNTSTFSSVISGAGGLTISGAGTAVLSGSNTYTGITTINAGSALDMVVGSGNTTTYAGGIAGAGGLTVSGGGTAVMGGASSFSGGAVIDGTSTLSVESGANLGANSTLTFSGAGAGESGTLAVTAAGAFTQNIALTTAGTFTITPATQAAFSGIISGAGDLTISGGGTAVLSGANTLSGDATVIGTTSLSISSAANLGTMSSLSFSGAGVGTSGTLVINGATTVLQDLVLTSDLTINATNNGTKTLSGEISGAGALEFIGNGTVIITGDNSLTYTGAVVIDESSTVSIASANALGGSNFDLTLDNEGVLRATDSLTISGDITINDGGGVFSVVAGEEMTVSGAIIDGDAIAGDLTLNGGGEFSISADGSDFDGDLVLAGGSDLTLTSSGADAFAGGAVIGNLSTLTGTGTISGAIAVNSGGTLAGTGNFGAVSVASGGTISPGNSAGEITIDSLSVLAGGNLQFDIDNNGVAILNDQISVTGAATIAAGADLDVLQTNYIPAGTSAAFIIAGGVATIGAVDVSTLLMGTDGTARSVIPITTYTLNAGGEVTAARSATAYQSAVAAAGGTGYQLTAAAALDQAAAAADAAPFGSTAAFVYSVESMATSNAVLLGLIGGMSPAADAASTQMPLASTRLFSRTHLEYSDDRRRAYGSAQWYSATNAGRLASASDDSVKESLAAQTKALKDPSAGGDQTNVYGRMVGGTDTYNGNPSQPGFKQNTYQALAGVDYAIEPGFMLGLLGGYARDTASINDGSSLDADAVVIAPYAVIGGDEGWFLDAMLSGSYGWWSSSRFVSTGVTASGDFAEWTVAGIARTGYDWYLTDDWRITPELGLMYLHVNNGGYTETGAGGSDLIVQSRSQDNALLTIGPELGWNIETSRGKYISISVQGGYEYMFGSQTSIASSFVAGGGSFLTPITSPDASRAYLGTSLAWPISDSATLTLEYEGLFSSDTRANGGMATLGFTF
ncbi:MAG: autotransporter domain-containing protein, partial [Phycisphaerales bacterium]|nr:autotransporter domain-containing protein [Phycisphaerales bacterium]